MEKETEVPQEDAVTSEPAPKNQNKKLQNTAPKRKYRKKTAPYRIRDSRLMKNANETKENKKPTIAWDDKDPRLLTDDEIKQMYRGDCTKEIRNVLITFWDEKQKDIHPKYPKFVGPPPGTTESSAECRKLTDEILNIFKKMYNDAPSHFHN